MSQSSNSTINRWLFGIVGILVLAIGLVTGYIITQQGMQAPVSSAQDSDADGVTEIQPPQPVPAFTLTDHNGDPITQDDLRGKPTLLTFGFTNCPDICPLTLQEFEDIASDLGAQQDNVNFVFVSVDGQRDTPARLREFFEVQQVDDIVIGMTGSETTIREFGSPYDLTFSYGEPAADGSYNVDHTAGTFLLDADLNWVKRYIFGTPNSVIVRDLRDLASDA